MTRVARPNKTASAEILLFMVGLALVTIASQRLIAYQAFQSGFAWLLQSDAVAVDAPARLTVPRLGMSVLVVDGDDPHSLALGAGHVTGTARIGESGNVVIAGHRDMAFHALKNIRVGDEIRVESGKTYKYIVNRLRIVDPKDVSILRDKGEAEITLITCYPFDYFGNAPKRYIVEAQMFRD